MSIKITYKDTEFSVGDTIKVNYKIKEKDKERIQAFDGVLLAIKGKGDNKSLTIQKSATDGVKVERIIPINSPWVDSIKKVRTAKVKIRRSKLYYLRDPKAKTV
jgi:large subunit ribosomal protein L19